MADILVPIEQEGTKAVVRAWLVKVGDRVAVNDPLVELETDKVAVEVPALAAGVVSEILLSADAEAVPGAVLGRISDGAQERLDTIETSKPVHLERSRETLPSKVEAPEQGLDFARPSGVEVEQSGVGVEQEMRLSPSVKRAIKDSGLDPRALVGSGRDGRLTRADVDRAVADGPVTIRAIADIAASHSVPHDRMRLRIAENMLASVTTAPHVTAMFEADFGAIIAHRAKHKDAFARDGAKLTYTAYIVAAAARAMAAAPAINSRWHEDRLEIFRDVNIGVGTALGSGGLIVPVLRDVGKLSLRGIAAGLDALVEKARTNKLFAQDVAGGTFTISNHGVSGSLFATPIIIAQPQSAILGVGKLEKRVVVREIDGSDAIVVRSMAYVSLTIDHRVVDGHQTNAWLSRFVDELEEWPLD